MKRTHCVGVSGSACVAAVLLCSSMMPYEDSLVTVQRELVDSNVKVYKNIRYIGGRCYEISDTIPCYSSVKTHRNFLQKIKGEHVVDCASCKMVAGHANEAWRGKCTTSRVVDLSKR